jgi:hypothetical protein
LTLPDELVGNWIEVPLGQIIGDDAEQRIQDAVKNRLTKIGVRDGGWTILYQDPSDKSYLELSFPQNEMHGGGPAKLTRINVEQIHEFYPTIPLL